MLEILSSECSFNYNKKSFIFAFIYLSPISAKRKLCHELCIKPSCGKSFHTIHSYLLLVQSKAHYTLIVSFQSKHRFIQGFVCWCLYFTEVLNPLCVTLRKIKKKLSDFFVTILIIFFWIEVKL